MKAITIMQPWAMLIALGEKQFETRSRSIKHRGELAIHAGKRLDKEACEIPEIKAALSRHGYTADNLPTGAVVAIAYLLECWKWDVKDGVLLRNTPIIEYEAIGAIQNNLSISDKEKAFGWFGHGRHAWQLDNVRMLSEPIPAKGQLSLWNWEGVLP
jgi:hypothetical protein